MGGQITLHVSLTGKSARAQVVFADPEQAFHFGIALDVPENIWGISMAPEDWKPGRPTLTAKEIAVRNGFRGSEEKMGEGEGEEEIGTVRRRSSARLRIIGEVYH